jgi:hypothetical protein
MSLQPDTDRRLDRTSRRLSANGARLLVLGAVLYIAGALLILLDISNVAGLMCIGLATPPTLGALALFASGYTANHAAKHRPWA